MNQETVTAVADNQTDWEQINQQAFEHSLRPVALPQRDGIPFWNQNARQFIMPPAFEIRPVAEAAEYLFTLRNQQKELLAQFKAKSQHEPLTGVWEIIPVGSVSLTVSALGQDGSVLKNIFQREFYRCAWFKGPYPAKSHDYRDAAYRCFAYIYYLPHVQAWLKNGTVDEKVYRKYCYPSKTLSAIINALLLHAKAVQNLEVQEKSLKIASRMADWLIDNSCPAGTPLEYLPPTYWKHATYHLAKPNIGQIMMIYPADVGAVYLGIYHRTNHKKYLDAAIRLGNTMKKLEHPDGSWYLKLYEKDGRPVAKNIVLVTQSTMDFLTELSAVTQDDSYLALRDRAYRRVLDHNLKLWDWDGQFEDVIPQEMYKNLTKNNAHTLAANLFAAGDIKTALKIVDWSEDQFVVWSNPNPALDTSMYPNGKNCGSMVMPTALEQYNCYWPVDSSMGNFISIWAKAYHYTGNRVYLEKAKALADAVLRNQRTDGSIPTWFFTTDLPDWLNCMVYTSETLLELDNTLRQ